ncbi:hypothetical protein IHE44_0004084 [Lamprotornis superbus]|uniref:Lipase maturation factor n=1 Tax=Lamprotornis superbus TaxID=245042 RepID=A0A835NFZ7_9PASS|nr:hypothetical protein IHE44_0004084 [Lamprotornis superbus]
MCFVGFPRVALINISEFGVVPFEKFTVFFSWMEKSPSVKKFQADKRIILSQGQYTQPVPNPVSYFMHRSPWWFHRLETLVNHFVELLCELILLACFTFGRKKA